MLTSDTDPCVVRFIVTAVGCSRARLQLAWSQSPALTLLSVLLTPPLPPLPPLPLPCLMLANEDSLSKVCHTDCLFLFSSPLSIFLFFFVFRLCCLSHFTQVAHPNTAASRSWAASPRPPPPAPSIPSPCPAPALGM